MSMSRFAEWRAKRGLDDTPVATRPISPLDRPIQVTFFRSHAAQGKDEETLSLRDLANRIRSATAPSKGLLPWLKLAAFGEQRTERGSLRHDANILQIYGVEADYDGESLTIDRARQLLGTAGVACMLYASPSHTATAPRWRVLAPTSAPLPPDQRAGLVARLNGLFAGALASESFTLSQAYYFGRVDGTPEREVVLLEGGCIDLITLKFEPIGKAPKPAVPPQQTAPTPRLPSTAQDGTRYALAALTSACDELRNAPDGEKHHTINRVAYSIGGLVTAGEVTESEAWGAMQSALGALLPRCKDPRAAERTMRQAFREGMAKPRTVPELAAEPPLAPAVYTITQQMIARAAAQKAPKAARPAVTSDLMDVPGALRLFIEHCERTAISRQPLLALAAGICMVGALAGRRYRTSTDLRTNIYAVGIADSGAGKDHARKQIRRCLYAANLVQYLGGADIASGSAMRTALMRHPAMLFQIDEFGDWLGSVLGDKAATHKKQIAAYLKELYSSANTVWAGTEYADQSKQGRPREDVQQPNACLYGTTTPGQLWGAVGGANLHDGLMARLLLFVSPCSYPDEQDPDLGEPPGALLEALQAIAAGPPQDGAGDLAQLMLATTAPQPYTVPETPEASAARRDLRRHQLEQQRQHEGTYVTSIAGRLAENAMKLALVRAISRDPAAPVIEAADVAWGRTVAQHCVDTLLREAARHVADNDYEAKLNRALEIIRKHGPLTQRDMFRRGFKLPERERGEILRSLIDGGMVLQLEAERDGPGRPAVRYAINGGVPE
jgi:hypothetical protein